MKKIELKPDGFACSYHECPPGLFLYKDMVGLKTEYGGDGYCDSGESFCKKDHMVIPLRCIITDEEI